MRRSVLLAIVIVLVLPLPGCGTEPAGLEGRLQVGERWVDAVVFHADLLRGASLVLYPGGRAALSLGHLGGHTDFLGTWRQARDRIHVELPTSQLLTGSWHAPVEEEPPIRIHLRRSGPARWRGTDNLWQGALRTRVWTEREAQRLSVREMQGDLAFVTRHGYEDELFGDANDEVGGRDD